MYPYISITEKDEREMLETIGVSSVSDLFADIPSTLSFKGNLNLPSSKSELEVSNILRSMASKNIDVTQYPSFLGGGAYDHYMPSVIKHLTGRSEYYTSYTPYQPEVSQGTLQYIFEFQTLISRLTGMDLSNASLYDGGTAITEAALMCSAANKKKKILVSGALHPQSIAILKTYAHVQGYQVEVLKTSEMVTDFDDLAKQLDEQTGCVILQSPNFYGYIEDVEDIASFVHEHKKTSLVVAVDPISLGVLKRPGDMGADVVVGEAQGMGLPLNFGGPYLGFMAVNKEYMRKIPGRIVGETVDMNGKRSYVLTLSAREQHIKREKATSNICSNQGLNVLAALIYMCALGKKGLREVAEQCLQKSHYAHRLLLEKNGFESASSRPFFKEFTLKTSVSPAAINNKLLENGILGGLDGEMVDPNLANHWIVAVTEKRTAEEIKSLAELAGGVK